MGDVVAHHGILGLSTDEAANASALGAMIGVLRNELLAALVPLGLHRTSPVEISEFPFERALTWLAELPETCNCVATLRQWGAGRLVVAYCEVLEEAPPGTPEGAVVRSVTGRAH